MDLLPVRSKTDQRLIEALKRIPRKFRYSLNQGYWLEALNDENNKTLEDAIREALKRQRKDALAIPLRQVPES